MLSLLTLVFLSPVPCSKLCRRAGQNWYPSDVYETGVNKDNELFVRECRFLFASRPSPLTSYSTEHVILNNGNNSVITCMDVIQ